MRRQRNWLARIPVALEELNSPSRENSLWSAWKQDVNNTRTTCWKKNLTTAQFDELICLRRCYFLWRTWSCSVSPEACAHNHSLFELICCWLHGPHSWSKETWGTKCDADNTKDYQIVYTTLQRKNFRFTSLEFSCAANISVCNISVIVFESHARQFTSIYPTKNCHLKKRQQIVALGMTPRMTKKRHQSQNEDQQIGVENCTPPTGLREQQPTWSAYAMKYESR